MNSSGIFHRKYFFVPFILELKELRLWLGHFKTLHLKHKKMSENYCLATFIFCIFADCSNCKYQSVWQFDIPKKSFWLNILNIKVWTLMDSESCLKNDTWDTLAKKKCLVNDTFFVVPWHSLNHVLIIAELLNIPINLLRQLHLFEMR